jgi:peptidoglycan-associated lipoprotein
MRLRLLSLAACLLVVAGCSTKPQTAANTSSASSSAATTSSIVPGSQEDLVRNVGDRVFFGYDRSDVTGEARATLDAQAAWLKRYPNVSLTVEGHADERGTREYNLALGERRATAARNYLVAQGIDASRLRTVSYGKERPAVLGSNEAAWAQNRRAVSVVN